MITGSQKTEACILLNKLKLLISEAAYIYDLKTLYTAIETGIDTAAGEAAAAAAAGGGAAGGADASGGTAASAPAGGAAAGGAVSLTPCTNISTTWLQTKLTELKTEINQTLIEITNQIQNNI